MIFSIGDHIQQIIDGTKTHTRRPTDRYEVGKDYAAQPGRGKKGIPEGRIKITHKWKESKARPWNDWRISKCDALKEGGYTPEEYEQLYGKMYLNWIERSGYQFKFIPSEGGKS